MLGAWPRAGGGGGWPGLFSSVCSAVGTASHADQGRRPPGSQLSASLEGRERGSCPRAFPTVEGATMPVLPSLKWCQARSAHPSAKLGDGRQGTGVARQDPSTQRSPAAPGWGGRPLHPTAARAWGPWCWGMWQARS